VVLLRRTTADDGGEVMLTILDSGALRSVGYLAVGALALVAGWRERSSPDRERLQLWPLYWWLTAAMVLAVALVHLGGLGDHLVDLGRQQARSAGWYDARRKLQASAVLILSWAWFMTVLLAIWRVPPRRRRYLPSAIAVGTLVAFVAIRAISLHQIDSLLYRRDVYGIHLAVLVEFALLAVACVSIVSRWQIDRDRTANRSDRVDALS
jgi:hypothetical protein